MVSKAIDVVLPPAKSEYEQWQRWLNRMETQLRTMHYSAKKEIEITEDSDGSTE